MTKEKYGKRIVQSQKMNGVLPKQGIGCVELEINSAHFQEKNLEGLKRIC